MSFCFCTVSVCISAIAGVSALHAGVRPGVRVNVSSKRKGGMFKAHVHERAGKILTSEELAKMSSEGVDIKRGWLDPVGSFVRDYVTGTKTQKHWVLLDAIGRLPPALVLKSDSNLSEEFSCADLQKIDYDFLISSRNKAVKSGDEVQVQYWTKKILFQMDCKEFSCAELRKIDYDFLVSSRDEALKSGDEERVQYWTKKISFQAVALKLYNKASDQECTKFLEEKSSLITRNDFSDFSIFENEVAKEICPELREIDYTFLISSREKAEKSGEEKMQYWTSGQEKIAPLKTFFEFYAEHMRLQPPRNQVLGKIMRSLAPSRYQVPGVIPGVILFAHGKQDVDIKVSATDNLNFETHRVQVVKRDGEVLPLKDGWGPGHYQSTARYFIEQLLALDNKHFKHVSTKYAYQFDMYFQHRNTEGSLPPFSMCHVDYGPVYGEKPAESSDENRWDFYRKPPHHLANFGLWIPTKEEVTAYYLAFLVPNSAKHSVGFHFWLDRPDTAEVSASALQHSSLYGRALKPNEAYFFSQGEYEGLQWKPGIPHGSPYIGEGRRSSVEVRGLLSESAESAPAHNNIIRGRIYYHRNQHTFINYEAEIGEGNTIIEMKYN